MKNLKTGLIAILVLLIPILAAGQQKTNIPELLGYPSNTKLLIIHADDMGLSHSTNAAVIKAFESGSITSGSMMVPCPWAAEMAACFIAPEHVENCSALPGKRNHAGYDRCGSFPHVIIIRCCRR